MKNTTPKKSREWGGGALIAVMGISIILGTTITVIVSFMINRTRLQSRILDYYEMTLVSEKLGQYVKDAFDRSEADGTGPAGTCPGDPASNVTTVRINAAPGPDTRFCFPTILLPNGINRCIGISQNNKVYCLPQTMTGYGRVAESSQFKEWMKNIARLLPKWFPLAYRDNEFFVNIKPSQILKFEEGPSLKKAYPITASVAFGFQWMLDTAFGQAGFSESEFAVPANTMLASQVGSVGYLTITASAGGLNLACALSADIAANCVSACATGTANCVNIPICPAANTTQTNACSFTATANTLTNVFPNSPRVVIKILQN